jgi:hypothetical protein
VRRLRDLTGVSGAGGSLAVGSSPVTCASAVGGVSTVADATSPPPLRAAGPTTLGGRLMIP